MEEFDNLKMEHGFMKAKLLIYYKRSKRSWTEKWELYKEQVGKIIQEAFESYWKDEKLHWLCLETYRQMIPHLVMLPFDYDKTQTHFRSTSEYDTHVSEE
jgi:hypothetical protein